MLAVFSKISRNRFFLLSVIAENCRFRLNLRRADEIGRLVRLIEKMQVMKRKVTDDSDQFSRADSSSVVEFAVNVAEEVAAVFLLTFVFIL